jgi:PadR family transcriptional regulator, regulatory protein AphA
VYSISDAGNDAFLAWLLEFPDPLTPPARDAFSLRIFFGARIGQAGLIRLLERFIVERKKRAEKMAEDKAKITELTKMVDKIASPEQEQCMRFISRRAQLTNETLIRWAEECIRELEATQRNEEKE